MRTEEPESPEEAAEILLSAGAAGMSVRPRGGGTKFDWGSPVDEPDIVLSTVNLSRVVEHNVADLTAVLEAGVPLATAQKVFAEAGQMLALDPPLGRASERAGDGAATIGGIVATGDSGPLRHRYGGPRDLLLGMTVALSDGTVAKSGGKVIKNVAGYDLAKLFAGSFGTLGLITQVAVRLHPLPLRRVSAVGFGDDPDVFQRAAIALAHSPLELESLDIEWPEWRGRVVARCAGAAPEPRAHEAVRMMSKVGLRAQVEEGDEYLWDTDNSRTDEATVVRVSALPSELARIIRIVQRLQGSLVARAGLGICWVWLPPQNPDGVVAAIDELRFSLAPFPCVVLDAPRQIRDRVDVWGCAEGPEVELMRRVKARFDPAGVCNPGVFMGGI
ncbi:MAG TPA: FAD-binding oxidoreductase [Actinomycetota bacterium]|nr:FAD-binding oxidoreductase [Actinomycetota bacterium]